MRQPRPRTLPKSPLQLDAFWIEALSVESNPEWNQEANAEADLPLSGRTEVAELEDGTFMIRLHVRTRGPITTVPYKISATVVGGFAVPHALPQDERLAFINLNGSSILYGIARGAIANVTGMGFWGMVPLPSVDFVRFFRRARAGT
jgi:preprotein translocase subunit SecB